VTTETQAGEPARKLGGGWEVIGPADCPILYRRTLLSGRFGKVLYHRFAPNMTDRVPHDHPASFLTVVVRGGYEDLQPCPHCSTEAPGWHLGPPSDDWRHARPMTPCDACGTTGYLIDRVRALAIRWRPAEHSHITRTGPDGATTLCLMGPKRREWGFWRDGQWYPWRTFERLFGLNWRCP
jgi:hypothetical protein